jgi:eukaryotic-like serine/threonine-protein kinase
MDELRAGDPRWIGAYRLLGRLGAGSMGRVFLARSERGRTVAVKLVRADLAEQDEFRSRFRREVQAARRVGGRWTAPVLDADTEAAVPWVVTGYVAGPSLQEVVAKEYGPLPERSVRVLAAGLAHALADIHSAGLVHRDLKPSNVMITIDGPRVIDFGIARALETVADGSLTHPGVMVGSPGFMSPEQVRGDRVTPACDIFCLGSVLAYAATGLPPFGAAGSGVHAQMFRIVQEPPDLDPVPEGLRELVAACLAKEPAARPSLAEVRGLLGDDDGTAHDADHEPDGEPWLPGAIVARLGRHAVRLLELESEAEVPPREDAAPERVAWQRAAPEAAAGSGPAGEAGAATRSDPGAAASTGTDAGAGSGTEVEAAARAASTSVSQPTRTPPPPPPGRSSGPGPGPIPGQGQGAEQGQGAGQGPGWAQPSYAPPKPKRRRGALIAAVIAFLAVVGGATAYVATRGGGGENADPAPSASTPIGAHSATGAPATKPARQPNPAGTGVPGGMVGVWRTSFTSADEGDNTRTLTVRANGTVELSGDSATYACSWGMHVVSAGPPVRLSPSKVVSGLPASSCSPGDATTLTLVDATHLRRDNVDPAKAPLTYEKVSG